VPTGRKRDVWTPFNACTAKKPKASVSVRSMFSPASTVTTNRVIKRQLPGPAPPGDAAAEQIRSYSIRGVEIGEQRIDAGKTFPTARFQLSQRGLRLCVRNLCLER
jgi:hypothetical protein